MRPATAFTLAVNWPVIWESTPVVPPLTLASLHETTPESSLALTETVTGLICDAAAAIVEGLADTLEMTGAVVSAGTPTFAVPVLELPDASLHVTVNEYVRPPTAFTVPVRLPVIA